MQFDSFSEFVAMGGYGFFVWLSFGVSFLALAGITLFSFWYRRFLVKKALSEMARMQRIKAARKASNAAEHPA